MHLGRATRFRRASLSAKLNGGGFCPNACSNSHFCKTNSLLRFKAKQLRRAGSRRIAVFGCYSPRALELSRPLVSKAQENVIRQSVVQADQPEPRRGFRRIAGTPVRRRAIGSGQSGTSQDLQRNRPKIFINEFLLEKFTVNIGPAFTQQRADAVLSPEELCGSGQIERSASARGDDLDFALTPMLPKICPDVIFSVCGRKDPWLDPLRGKEPVAEINVPGAAENDDSLRAKL